VKVGVGVIPKEALAVLAAGFARHNDHWVEAIARSFLEAWQGASMLETGQSVGYVEPVIILPLEPVE